MINWNDIFKYEEGWLIWKIEAGGQGKGGVAGTISNKGYYLIFYNNKTYRGARVIWEMHNGKIPQNMEIDHINRDKQNNRLENLRCVTKRENLNNRAIPINKTGYKGVYTSYNKFVARIKYNNKSLFLGSFKTAIEAANAYDTKAKELLGEFAILNFKERVLCLN